MDTLIKDIRYGLRSLTKRPAFTTIAVLTLALGIGASTAIFSVVDGVLLRPLPYPNADRMVQVREVNERGAKTAFTDPNFADVRALNHTFAGVAQYGGRLTTVSGASEPVRVAAFVVSEDFFSVVGAKPVVGRTFLPEESKPGGAPVAVVSYAFWQRLLGGRSDLAGLTLRLMDKTVTVVGVMPAGFAFPRDAEVWVPRELFPRETSRSAHNWSVVARLRPDVTTEQAQTELSGIAKRLKQEYGKEMDALDFAVVPQQEYMVGNVRSALVMMFVAVGFLLLVACANVTNLLLAQVTTRQRDFAVRAALGATRLRLARQFVTENVLMVLIAGSLGVLMSFWAVNVLVGLSQQTLPRVNEVAVDTRAVAFTVGLSLLIGVILGLVPLFRFSATNLETTLRETGTGARGYAGRNLRSLLVVAQMALTLILLVGTGLLGKSFYRLLQVDPGFQTESAVAMDLSLPSPATDEQRYKQFMESYRRLKEQGVAPEDTLQLSAEENRQRLFHSQVLENLSSTPGVVAVGSISNLPLTGGGPDGTFFINNNPARKGNADYRRATGGYFAAMKIPLLRGRTFDAGDQPNSLHAAVISQSLAQKYWPNEDPIGQAIQFGNMDGDLHLLHIVGVVGDVREYGVDEQIAPTVYANALQRPPSSNLTVVARAQSEPTALIPTMREAVRSRDPQVPLKFRTLDQIFSSSLDQRRFSLIIFGFFGLTAMLLATMGIYGVTAYVVAQRTQEIGLRMALGAQISDVLKLVLGNAMSLVVIGAIIGVVGAYATTRLMSSLLFGVSPTDITTFIAVPTVLLLIALIASFIPARRATKVDPLIALRYE